ncbi:hypothetical protein PVT68_13780 [Microbulbifer bruguierae]|uniref:Uncharacterized protein n=1 Tax=Microbulbifer bruguierae TaxID=3029061 RepID=A0ABY8NA98_9GAMM|nr:hypothetical protein [Microbulbifer bruguierae]WGL15836.1 hypothetical protein PVT68_13780 [Microbulbifer bruguierae]
MDIVIFLFQASWIAGVISGLAAAMNMAALNKHAVRAPWFLKLSGISLLFSKCYPNHNMQRKITLTLELICVFCIFLTLRLIIQAK